MISCDDCLDCCFFFKQKTAYEMRISDWSSDVCSSDLRVVHDPLEDGLRSVDALLPELARCTDQLSQHPMPRAEHDVEPDVVVFGEQRVLEIGRASCRESVCQYV